MANQDREGNVLYPPSRSQKPKVGGEEILASYARFTQRGCTLAMNASAGPGTDGVLPAGTYLVKIGKKYAPYSGSGTDVDEGQTVTEGGSGLTSFTLTFSGQTTGSIAAAATSSAVQTALEGLSNIDPGDVAVTGSAGGPYTVTFQGQYQNTNVSQMTATPTGGSGTVTVATATGGVGGTTCRGILRNSVDISGGDKLGNIVTSGIVKASVVANANSGTSVPADVVSDLNGRVDTDADQFIF